MSAGDAERRSAHQHARTGNIAGVDGVPQGNVAVALRPHVAHGGEARLEREARVVRAGQRGARQRDAEALRPGILRIAGQMGVRVSQARQDGRGRKIDQAIAGSALGL